MVSLPAVLSENLPLDIVIVMLGTNDANSRYKNNAKAIADDLEEMIRMIQAGEWQSNTKFKTPKVLVIAPRSSLTKQLTATLSAAQKKSPKSFRRFCRKNAEFLEPNT